MLFGYKKSKNGGISIGLKNNCEKFRLLFERKKLDGNKLLYCFYNVQFKPASLVVKTVENGDKEEEILEIEFDVYEDEKLKDICYIVDTENANKEVVDNWFREIQIP